MGVVAELLAAVPAAERYRAALESLERENATLKAENARLRDEALALFTETWETLDGDAVRALQHLSGHARASAGEIAAACGLNFAMVESYLGFLARHEFVRVVADGAPPAYGLAQKGRRYLQGRGLLAVS